VSDDAHPPAPNLSLSEQARLAQELINNPLLEQLFVEMDHQATLTWRRSSSAVQREEQWNQVVAIAMLRKMIQSRVENLKLQAGRDTRHKRPVV
jgi:hypothetical protein